MGFMRDHRAIREFAAAHGWTFTTSPEDHEAILERLRGEPFHPEPPEPSPYLVLGRRRHRLSPVMRGACDGGSAVVFLYTAEQEILDDGFGRRGRETSAYWGAALVDLPVRVPRLQLTPRTAVRPSRPGIATAAPRVAERFHVHTDDPVWAARVTRELAPIKLDGGGRAWRISGTTILTWEHALTGPPRIPLDRVDAALAELALIAGRLSPPAQGTRAGDGPH
ncbi:hypothetical protein [Actinoallomurus soli]|uniref:hypothetical protein n=1 Tax=Actinoallomurus soli TaxID=2952535 RepID=UPI002093643E|nr:hypothetical protein [Actinoallomurus soli]MCO5975027.1 hypothetical protein [Actinoallomurus soli]